MKYFIKSDEIRLQLFFENVSYILISGYVESSKNLIKCNVLDINNSILNEDVSIEYLIENNLIDIYE